MKSLERRNSYHENHWRIYLAAIAFTMVTVVCGSSWYTATQSCKPIADGIHSGVKCAVSQLVFVASYENNPSSTRADVKIDDSGSNYIRVTGRKSINGPYVDLYWRLGPYHLSLRTP